MSQTKVRINKFDNMKGLAIFLIVIWHLEILRVIPPLGYKIIYIFSLPVFFFVAGYFSKTSPDQLMKSVKRLLIPYIIFCAITRVVQYAVTGDPYFDIMFIRPSFALWFLISLFMMKLFLPVFDRMKHPILISLIIALFFGFYVIKPNLLGLARTFGYMPVFLFGFYYKDISQKVTDSYPRLVELYNRYYIILFIVLLAGMLFVLSNITVNFQFRAAYQGFFVFGMIKRLFLIFCYMAGPVMLMKVMTNRECFLTKWGRNSMAIYLLHCYFRITLEGVIPNVFEHHLRTYCICITLLIFAVTIILSRDVVTKYLNKFTDGVYDLIFKKIPL